MDQALTFEAVGTTEIKPERNWVFLADTHLGIREESPSLEDGTYLKEHDASIAFVELAIWARENDCGIVVLGDMFDTYHPTNGAIETILKVSRAHFAKGLALVWLKGNHELSPIWERPVAEVLRGVGWFICDKIDTYKLPFENEITFACIPAVREALDTLPEGDVLLYHGAVRTEPTIKEYKTIYDFIPAKPLLESYKVAFCGDLHRYLAWGDSHYYIGPPERFTFAQENQKVGGMLWDVEGKVTRIIRNNPREYLTLGEEGSDRDDLDHCVVRAPKEVLKTVNAIKKQRYDTREVEKLEIPASMDLTQDLYAFMHTQAVDKVVQDEVKRIWSSQLKSSGAV